MTPRRSEWVVALACTLLSLALRAHDFGNPAINVDEQYYLLVGDRMLRGALPYLDLWDRKPVGLFLIFAATRLLPGDGILAYQLVAALFAGGTSCLVWRMSRRLGASEVGAASGAASYLIWLHLFSGGGGQSPVFYNLFTAVGATLTLALPTRESRRAVLWSGCIACLSAGLAIQTKYTAAVEGAMFGLTHVWHLRRAGGRLREVIGAGILWLLLGIAPTVAAIGAYSSIGSSAFHAFWFANFQSIMLRGNYHYPAALIAGRLAGISGQLAPLAFAAGVTLWRQRNEAVTLAGWWLLAALLAFVSIGTFFDDYALPLILPLAVLAAPAIGQRAWRAALLLTVGLADYGIRVALRPNDGPAVRRVAAAVAANSQGRCPYVFVGDSIVYYLAHACTPTRYAFPSTLAYAPEAGATGVDEAAEVRRIMAGHPPVVVTATRPLAEWNKRSHSAFTAALKAHYRLLLTVPREDYSIEVYRLR